MKNTQIIKTILIGIFCLVTFLSFFQNIPQPPKNCVWIYVDSGFRKSKLEICLDDYSAGEVHSIHHTHLNDKTSSMAWNLEERCILTLSDHTDGTGRTYSMRGKGSDADTHNENFGDCASAFFYRCD